VNRDQAQAATLFKDVCDCEGPGGCNNFGLSNFYGEAGRRDVARAAKLFRQACDKGNVQACYNGGDFEPDLLRMEQACERGFAPACNNLGVRYWNGKGVARDPEHAVRFYQRACDQGSGLGCTNLAVLYLDGRTLPPDPQRAGALLRRGCNKAEPAGCALGTGVLYERGIGVATTDRVGALDAYRQSCEAGYLAGCQQLKRLGTSP
jgi:hypothetical protein